MPGSWSPLVALGVGGSVSSLVADLGLCLVAGGVLAIAFVKLTIPAIAAICAGLPLVLQGVSSDVDAVFEPVGWLPMVALIGVIAARASLRSAVVVPERRLPEHVN